MKKAFAFGTTIHMSYITDHNTPSHTKYQNFVYDNFEWAVPEGAMKWFLMESTKVQIIAIDKGWSKEKTSDTKIIQNKLKRKEWSHSNELRKL